MTAQKIDQIESEMIHGAAPSVAANSTCIGPVADATQTASAAPASPPDDRVSSLAQAPAATSFGIDVGDAALPAHLEETAILYANGQFEAAIEALEPTLDASLAAGFERLAWLMMFDLCQFSGDRQRFDAISIEYATRFETSPPVWNDRLAPAREDDAGASSAIGAARVFPEQLDAGCSRLVDDLIKSAARREPLADFSAVRTVSPDGAAAVLRLFAGIVSSNARLRLAGVDALRTASLSAIEAGGNGQSEANWMLALYTLRLLDRRQQFDDLSIDYCVTFEVSPPPWEPAPPALLAGVSRPAPESGAELETTTRSGPTIRASTAFVLSGELIGRVQPELQSLKAYARDRSEVIVDCRELRRMDFGAAGELLNEIVNLRALGKNLLFIEPNYLVHGLMMVMGMHELVEIRRRKI